MNLIYGIYEGVRRAGYFAPWARSKNSDLSVPRKKHLSENDAVIWDIGKESPSAIATIKNKAHL